jgi:hypothetical protein
MERQRSPGGVWAMQRDYGDQTKRIVEDRRGLSGKVTRRQVLRLVRHPLGAGKLPYRPALASDARSLRALRVSG